MMVTYEACFQKVHAVVWPCVAFPGPGNIYKPGGDCVLEYASSTQAVQSSGSSFGSSCSSFSSHLQI